MSHNFDSEIEIAALEGDFEKFEHLYRREGYEPNRISRNGMTFLHYASGGISEEKALPIIKFLIEENTSPFQVDSNFGRLPFHYAAENGYHQILDFYVKLGVGIDTKDGFGMSALDILIESRKNAATVAWLVIRGARLTKTIEFYPTMLSTIEFRPDAESTKSAVADDDDAISDEERERTVACCTWQQKVKVPTDNDICITIGDRLLYTKRMLLIEHSGYFARTLHELSEEKKVPMPVSYDSMYSILEWLYTGNIKTDDMKLTFRIWNDANTFEMNNLTKYTQVKKLIPLIQRNFPNDEGHRGARFLKFVFQVFFHFINVKNARYIVRFTAAILLQNITAVYVHCCQDWSIDQLTKFVELLYVVIEDLAHPGSTIEMDRTLIEVEDIKLLEDIDFPLLEFNNQDTNNSKQPSTDSQPPRQGFFAFATGFVESLASLFKGRTSLLGSDIPDTQSPNSQTQYVHAMSMKIKLLDHGKNNALSTVRFVVKKPVKYFWTGERIIQLETDSWCRISSENDEEVVKQIFLYDLVQKIEITSGTTVSIHSKRNVEVYHMKQIEDADILVQLINERRKSEPIEVIRK